MGRKLLAKIIGGFIGFIVGVFGGGYIGLIVGGTFLGGFDIYKNTGIEGYELTAYVGAIIGATLLTILGVKIALRIINEKEVENSSDK